MYIQRPGAFASPQKIYADAVVATVATGQRMRVRR
jgi:hypothetical protein